MTGHRKGLFAKSPFRREIAVELRHPTLTTELNQREHTAALSRAAVAPLLRDLESRAREILGISGPEEDPIYGVHAGWLSGVTTELEQQPAEAKEHPVQAFR